jgi:hypothetical protein
LLSSDEARRRELTGPGCGVLALGKPLFSRSSDGFWEYLKNLTDRMTANRMTNDETADALSRAKLCGVLAPIIALGVSFISLLFRF